MRAFKGQVSDAVPHEVFGGETGRIDNRELAGLKRRAKLSSSHAVVDAVPCEEIAGETVRLDASQISSLLEKSEGPKPIAVGTPRQGLPQLEEEQAIEVDVAPRVDMEPPTRRNTRLRDFSIGGAIAIGAMVAWYCATQL